LIQRLLTLTILGAITCAAVSDSINTASAADPPALPARDVSADEVDNAVDVAIKYLVSQQKENGLINDQRSNEVAMTSLALMAMAAVGHQPSDSTAAGAAMHKGLEYVLGDDRQADNGYFGSRDGSRMYGHGITTLMLSELLGMGLNDAQDLKIRQRCQKAVDLILRAQQVKKSDRETGGWRYTPEARDADLSVSVWQVMALRSAKNAGLDVPGQAIQEAIEYLRRSNTRDRSRSDNQQGAATSGFSYQPGTRDATFTMTSAGLLAMQVCGQYEAREVLEATDWLADRKLEMKERFFFYGTYYYAQGMYQRGGDYAAHARRNVEEILLRHQRPDGSWQSEDGQERSAGNVYATSMAVLSLSVKYHFLPIYQR
jgi:hypothetical protein